MKILNRGSSIVYRLFAGAIAAVFVGILLPVASAYALPAINEYSTPTPSSGSVHMTLGPDGNIWFTEYSADKIGKINPTTKVITEYAIPTSGARPWGITAGPDGNVWFVENLGHKVGKITPNGVITEYTLGGNTNPSDITTGPDGNLWVTSVGGNSIAKINPSSGAILASYSLGGGAKNPAGITTGPDGNLWFVENTGNAIGKMTTSGAITEYTLPNGGSRPWQITTGPDGNLWFTEQDGNRIGKMTTGGSITEYSLPGGSNPWGIVVGPDDNLWVTLSGSNKIAMVSTGGVLLDSLAVPTSASTPAGIAKDTHNKVWFVEFIGKVGEVTDITIPPYDDGDGVSEAVENGAPNGGDGNNDGIPDGRQSHVTSFISPITGKYVTIAVNSACTLSSTSVVAEASRSMQDANYIYPVGLVRFTASCGTPGYTATVQQYYHDPPSGDFALRKEANGIYATISGASITSQTIGGSLVLVASYAVTDGGSYDEDGIANGVIVDPAGLAVLVNNQRIGAPNTGVGPQESNIGAAILFATAISGFVMILVFSLYRFVKK